MTTIPFIRYKTIYNQTYAYKVWKEKNKNNQWQQKTQYLGVVTDKQKGTYQKRQKQTKPEKQILDYGDTYLLHQIIKNLPIHQILQPTFKNHYDTLITLILHRLTGGTAMCYTENYYNGNYIKKLYPNAKIKSQDISRFLTILGNEHLQKTFLNTYIPLICQGKTGIIIDSTGLPNEIHMPITDWGYHNGHIAFETRLILVVDKKTGLPLYFRYVEGNVGDVSTLVNTVVELKQFGVLASFVLVDAGYFSEGNLQAFFDAKVDFLIRVPVNRVVCREFISESGDIEDPRYAVRCDKRGLFVKEKEVVFCGAKCFLYLVLDPQRRGREIADLLSEMDENGVGGLGLDFSCCGKMVVMSSSRLGCDEVVPLYYTRQVAERLFGVAKEDLGLLPLRTHSEFSFCGFMMLIFLCLIVYCGVKAVLGSKVTLEYAVSLMRNLKCRVFDGGLVVPCEVTKQQRLLLESLGVEVPKVNKI